MGRQGDGGSSPFPCLPVSCLPDLHFPSPFLQDFCKNSAHFSAHILFSVVCRYIRSLSIYNRYLSIEGGNVRMPMGFDLTEEQLQVKRSVREFAEAEIKPHVMEWDEAQRLPREIFTKMGELGLMGVLFPEEYGGAGMGYVEYATVIEEISRVDGSVGLSLAAHNSLCTNHIFQYGSEAQRKKDWRVGIDRARIRLRRFGNEDFRLAP